MKISIVTAVYNRAGSISGALRSLHAQSHSDIEHVIQYSGIYEALNRGIARATGDVVVLLHLDDMFAHSEVLSNVAVAFEGPAVHVVYSDLECVAKEDPSRMIRCWKSGGYRPALLRHGWMPPHPTLFLRREVFSEHGDYDMEFRIAADYEAALRWLKGAELKLAYIPDVFVRMRVGGESNRSLNRILQKSREDLRAIRRHRIGGLAVQVAKNLTKVSEFLRRARNAGIIRGQS